MCELTLQADGFRDEEAQVARRLYGLTHETPQELPAWLTRKATWSPFVDVPPHSEESLS